MARATQRPLGIRKPGHAGMGPVTGCGNGERDKGRDGRQKAPSNSPVVLGHHSPWSGEPGANHGEPGHVKSGKCPKIRDGREVSAGVRVHPEVPGSMAGVQVGSRVSGTWRNVERVAPALQPRMDDTRVHLGAEWVLQPVRDGDWWNVVERERCFAVHDGYPQETRLQSAERLC